jgi:SAM-dependent methyltransferase
MIDSCVTTHPSTPTCTFSFAVGDCSIPSLMQHDSKFDIVFAGWFLNYAGTEKELINMFKVIEQNLKEGGRFVGVTTNAHDPFVQLPKLDFYGIDVHVLDAAYVAPDTRREVGIKAKVAVGGEGGFAFDVFQFRAEVYERCAKEAGLRLRWCELVLPEDERREQGYWERYVERPTFDVVEAVRL